MVFSILFRALMWITYLKKTETNRFYRTFRKVIHRQNDDTCADTHLSILLVFLIIKENAGGMRCQQQKKLNY